jgi:hypothetical protein
MLLCLFSAAIRLGAQLSTIPMGLHMFCRCAVLNGEQRIDVLHIVFIAVI